MQFCKVYKPNIPISHKRTWQDITKQSVDTGIIKREGQLVAVAIENVYPHLLLQLQLTQRHVWHGHLMPFVQLLLKSAGSCVNYNIMPAGNGPLDASKFASREAFQVLSGLTIAEEST